MIKKLQKIIAASLLALGLVAGPALVAAPAHAQTKEDICKGVLATGSGAGCDNSAETDVDRVVRLVIQIFSWVVGIASVIMIIVGGFKYIISSGDSGNINSAKNTILYAVIGLVVVALAQVIVRFVLDKAA